MKHIKNNQKSIPAYRLEKSQEKNLWTKSLETFAKCLWFPKRKQYKNLKPSLWNFILWDFHLCEQPHNAPRPRRIHSLPWRKAFLHRKPSNHSLCVSLSAKIIGLSSPHAWIWFPASLDDTRFLCLQLLRRTGTDQPWHKIPQAWGPFSLLAFGLRIMSFLSPAWAPCWTQPCTTLLKPEVCFLRYYLWWTPQVDRYLI
jgi:hypothetical protein